MLGINISNVSSSALDAISLTGGAVKRGTVKGLNRVAFDARKYEKTQIPIRLDRPAPFTEKGVQVVKAAVAMGAPEATVKMGDQRQKYLRPQEFGGTYTRNQMRATRGSGSSRIVIPMIAALENHFGSAGRDAVTRALAMPRSFYARGTGMMHGGVFQRVGASRLPIRPLLIFSDQVDFTPTLHFQDDVSSFARPRIYRAVSKAIDRELRRTIRI